MKRLSIAILVINVLLNVARADEGCPSPCCGGGHYDRINVWLIGMGPTLPGRGYIDIGIFDYNTTEDGCASPIEYIVEYPCASWNIGYRMAGKSWGCLVICGNPNDCPEHIVCVGCPGLFSHGCGEVQWLYFLLAGKGNFKVLFKGIEVFNQPFDFGGVLEYFDMTFTDIMFLNKDFTEIQTNDIFDAMEAVAIEVVAEFLGDEPAPGIGVVLKSDIGPDSIMVSVPLEETHFNTATYLTLIEPGFFVRIIGDPDETLPPYAEAEITAAPIPYRCAGEPPVTVPEDILPIANFVLWVEEISFELDYFNLCKDGPGPTPGSGSGEPIIDPVWIKDTKNDPVVYRRGNTLLMNVLVECNRTPYHDFQYWIIGSGGSGQGSYTTAVCEGHFNGTNLSTVDDIAPRDGPFPDYVGIIDPLNYHWYANKGANADPSYFKYLNSSSHKIYLTYEAPLFSPVNIIALDKICAYAHGKNEPSTIAESGVGGVYAEGWTYYGRDPISEDPLDVIRNQIGQCSDYANLLTYLYKSIGIPANSVITYNGCSEQGTDYWLFWRYTLIPNAWVCLLSNLLTSCDNQTQIWPFSFHATSFAAGLLCDASFGIIDTRANYAEWWRYYLQPADLDPPDPPGYLHDEPPTFEPTYYDWPEYVPMIRPLPYNIQREFIDFWHPW